MTEQTPPSSAGPGPPPHQDAVSVVNHAMAADDVRTVLRHPATSVAGDGWELARSPGYWAGTCAAATCRWSRPFTR
jgi:hypothetical protein